MGTFSKNPKSTKLMSFHHDSFFGWLNLLQRQTNAFNLPMWWRPANPIIIDEPGTYETINNLNKADLGAFITMFGIGSLVSYSQAKCGTSFYYEARRWYKVNMLFWTTFAFSV